MQVYMVLFNKDTFDSIGKTRYNKILNYVVKILLINKSKVPPKIDILESRKTANTQEVILKKDSKPRVEKQNLDIGQTLTNAEETFSDYLAKVMFKK